MPKRSANERQGPDYGYWSKRGYWPVEVATALLAGLDPDTHLEDGKLSPNCAADERRAYDRMFGLFQSHIGMAGLSGNPTPTAAIRWALYTKVDPPTALVDAVRKQGPTLIEVERELEQAKREVESLRAELSAKAAAAPKSETVSGLKNEQRILQKLLLGMAALKFQFDPKKAHCKAATNISEKLVEVGLSVTAETIRKHLAEAVEAVGDELKPLGTG